MSQHKATNTQGLLTSNVTTLETTTRKGEHEKSECKHNNDCFSILASVHPLTLAPVPDP